MKLKLIPSGKFLMGSPPDRKESPGDERQHEVEITSAFYLGIHEVTQAEYQFVMGYNPSMFTPQRFAAELKGLDTSRFPVERVSWKDAAASCKKLSARTEEKRAGRTYRLPTEAEWEYASRGGAGVSAPFNVAGKPVFALSSREANFDGTRPYGDGPNGPCLGRPTVVGSYPPNAFGLYDMHGNVFEWCADGYSRDYYKYSPRKDPFAPLGNNGLVVVRGGSFRDPGTLCRSAYRYNERAGHREMDIGFRIACSLRPASR